MRKFKKVKITPRQKQIIIGKILGDGHLETNNGLTYRLRIEHGQKQKNYVFWLYQELENLAAGPPRLKIRKGKNGTVEKKWWFDTVFTISLRFYAQQFYQEGKKVVPRLIHRWLTPLTLAIWFMDDGSVKAKNCRCRLLNTQAFDEVSLKRLQAALKRNFDLETKLRQQKEGKQIYIPAGEYDKFKKIVQSYVLPEFEYKLG